MTASSPKTQVRAGWVTAWNPAFHSQKELDDTLDAAKMAGLNMLFVQARKVADAYYDSRIEPRGDGIAPGFDPLGAAVKQGHARKMRIHAWVNALRVWRAELPPTDPSHVVLRHPEWLNKTKEGALRSEEGQYLDPGIPEVREYVASVAADIAQRYAVDGIHLDYIRYPGPDWGYSELALERYRAETGAKGTPASSDTKWMAWRREQVTKLVSLIRHKVRTARPRAELTAATISWTDCPADFRSSTPYRKVLQDWKRWMAEGLLDANVPMNYRTETNPVSAQQFRDWLAGYTKWGYGRPVYVGIAAHINSPASVIKEIAAVEKAKMAGWVIFPFDQSARRTALVKALAARTRARETHADEVKSTGGAGL